MRKLFFIATMALYSFQLQTDDTSKKDVTKKETSDALQKKLGAPSQIFNEKIDQDQKPLALLAAAQKLKKTTHKDFCDNNQVDERKQQTSFDENSLKARAMVASLKYKNRFLDLMRASKDEFSRLTDSASIFQDEICQLLFDAMVMYQNVIEQPIVLSSIFEEQPILIYYNKGHERQSGGSRRDRGGSRRSGSSRSSNSETNSSSNNSSGAHKSSSSGGNSSETSSASTHSSESNSNLKTNDSSSSNSSSNGSSQSSSETSSSDSSKDNKSAKNNSSTTSSSSTTNNAAQKNDAAAKSVPHASSQGDNKKNNDNSGGSFLGTFFGKRNDKSADNNSSAHHQGSTIFGAIFGVKEKIAIDDHPTSKRADDTSHQLKTPKTDPILPNVFAKKGEFDCSTTVIVNEDGSKTTIYEGHSDDNYFITSYDHVIIDGYDHVSLSGHAMGFTHHEASESSQEASSNNGQAQPSEKSAEQDNQKEQGDQQGNSVQGNDATDAEERANDARDRAIDNSNTARNSRTNDDAMRNSYGDKLTVDNCPEIRSCIRDAVLYQIVTTQHLEFL